MSQLLRLDGPANKINALFAANDLSMSALLRVLGPEGLMSKKHGSLAHWRDAGEFSCLLQPSGSLGFQSCIVRF